MKCFVNKCQSYGLCAADCPLAPWNQDCDRAPHRFAYLVRQRRWAQRPVDRRDIFFMDHPHRPWSWLETL